MNAGVGNWQQTTQEASLPFCIPTSKAEHRLHGFCLTKMGAFEAESLEAAQAIAPVQHSANCSVSESYQYPG